MPVRAAPSTGSSTSSTARSKSGAIRRPPPMPPTAGTTRPSRSGAKGPCPPWPRPESRSQWPISCPKLLTPPKPAAPGPDRSRRLVSGRQARRAVCFPIPSRALAEGDATVHGDPLPGDVAGEVAGEEGGDVADILRGLLPGHGDAALDDLE